MIALVFGCTLPGSVSPILPGGEDPVNSSITPRFPDTAAASDPPNILVVISDDIGIEASACYSDLIDVSRAPQPTIEGLCADGLRFTDAWSYPLCSPTRAAMMTGRYGWRTGVGRALDDSAEPLSPDEITLPDLIEGETAYIGKWHLTGIDRPEHPHELGWSHFSGTLFGAIPDYRFYEKVVNGEPVSVEGYATTEVVDDALDWLEGQDDAPWMMWVSFNAPHTPLHAPPVELHSYELKTLSLTSQPVPFFQAMIEAMDVELGRLLDGIDRDNTVIIYVGDNGTDGIVNQEIYRDNHDKGSLGQGGVHVPLIISGPGIPTGDVDAMVHVIDLYSTILELRELPPRADEEHDSVSLRPYFLDPAHPPQRELMLTELFGDRVPESLAGRSARTADYKLIRLFTGEEELYNLHEDPTGEVDLMLEPLTEASHAAALLLGNYLDQIEVQAGF
jgi:arylsulfatase B